MTFLKKVGKQKQLMSPPGANEYRALHIPDARGCLHPFSTHGFLSVIKTLSRIDYQKCHQQ